MLCRGSNVRRCREGRDSVCGTVKVIYIPPLMVYDYSLRLFVFRIYFLASKTHALCCL
jgi:hypothetical protein